ncbi:uncharacterized protein LOC105176708 [Sesamum indicum]|uniref:Uncharacterized protein LOC105176708 n=1 Tax=Sesamum indicum TaxID=4182 RepID=A0A6I9UIN0_SESIN|nr:uncharacterized protein LOC105176708 [Sesamum indicum]XP_020554507.1 uncharacterized protein LOC105176708 [Sesamum indicum]XP_020554508.1 uncharacterized protein LOC105176708 [Sesamum indicum]
MVQALEAVRGGGGSIKVGTTGTISALMTRELDSTKSESKVPSLSASVSVLAADTTPRRVKPGTSAGEVGSSSSSSSNSCKNHKGPETVRRRKHQSGSSETPMLTADDISIDGTPIRQKPIKKGINAVAIVDIKCGNPVNPITNRLKKLGFSKSSNSSV